MSRLAPLLLCLGLLAASPASAQRPRASEVLRLARARLGGTPQAVGRAIHGGGGRWVALVTSEPRTAVYVLHALVLERRRGSIELVRRLELPTNQLWAATNGQPLPQPRVLSSRLDDWDDDDERELEIVVAYNTDEPCTAATAYRHYYVVEPRDGRLAAAVVIREGVLDEPPNLRGTILHEDVDGDGHRDLVFRHRRCERDPESEDLTMRCGRPSRRTFRWTPATDSWTAVPESTPPTPCPGEG